MNSHSKALLEIGSLRVEVAGYTVCQGLNLALYPGQCWAMLGVNGVGKTTLLHTLAGLRPAQSGNVFLKGAPLEQLTGRARAQQLGLVFQDRPDQFPTTVLETVLASRYPYLGWLGWETERDKGLVYKALAAVDLANLAHRETTSLSGGERQRLRIAAFLAQDTALGLLDEPLNHLDPAYQVRIISHLVERARHQGGALLMVLHDVNLAARFCDHCLLIHGDGTTSAGSTEEVLTENSLQRLYHHPIVPVVTPWGRGWLPG